ncbi:MAG: diguanylate cyclase domain-containing protein, partial [Bacillota bacterium]
MNDTYGHQCGDLILKNVAAGIASSIRKTDCL